MDLSSLTREHRMLGAAGASVLFIIMLFLPWFGEGGFDASGSDVVPSWWVLLIFAAAAAALLAADALNFDLPVALHPTAVPAFLTTFNLIVTTMFLLDSGGIGRKIGLFLAFIFALVACALAVTAWREDRAR